jgi:hypothetical protein
MLKKLNVALYNFLDSLICFDIQMAVCVCVCVCVLEYFGGKGAHLTGHIAHTQG